MNARTKFFHGSPAQERAARDKREAEFLADMRVRTLTAAAAVRREAELIVTHLRDVNKRHVAEFRAALPAHRLHWFDGLTDQEQFQVSRPLRLDTRSDDQRDYDAADAAHGWPEG